jgi:uncharacterized protein (DUF302 family)
MNWASSKAHSRMTWVLSNVHTRSSEWPSFARRVVRAAARLKGGAEMAIKQISVERFSVISCKRFDDVVAAFEAAVGHHDTSTLWKSTVAAGSYAEIETLVQKMIGGSGFMEFARYDLGIFLRKASGAATPRILRLVIGNPLIMKKMAEHVPDAGSYAPVTVLIDERKDGVHISYDRMASYLASYGSAEALEVAQDLDAKVEVLLTAAAG